MKSNYMRAAELKIAKLDPIDDLFEITYLQFSAKVQEAVLQQALNEQKDFSWLEKIALFTPVKEKENELRNM